MSAKVLLYSVGIASMLAGVLVVSVYSPSQWVNMLSLLLLVGGGYVVNKAMKL